MWQTEIDQIVLEETIKICQSSFQKFISLSKNFNHIYRRMYCAKLSKNGLEDFY